MRDLIGRLRILAREDPRVERLDAPWTIIGEGLEPMTFVNAMGAAEDIAKNLVRLTKLSDDLHHHYRDRFGPRRSSSDERSPDLMKMEMLLKKLAGTVRELEQVYNGLSVTKQQMIRRGF